MIPGSGNILSLIMSGEAPSRASLARISGFSRTTVGQRLATLFNAGLVCELDETVPSGGRPARVLRLNTDFGTVLAADIGESHIRAALTDLTPRILAESVDELHVDSGPVPILTCISRRFRELLARTGRAEREVLGIGISLPAPVDHGAGRVVGPSVMRGWDDFDIPGWFRDHFRTPVFAENDVNLLALAEHRFFWPEAAQFLFIKAGTGIGSGIVTDGRIYRGAQGAAGDIGHIQLDEADPPLCRCGKLGCVEASAAGWALARDLSAKGLRAHNARDVLALARSKKPEAVRHIRDAGRVLGKVAADVVSVLNPSVIVVGGTLAGAGEHLLSGIREFVYQRCLPLATRELGIFVSRSAEPAGIIGAAQLVIDVRLEPRAIEQILAERATAGA